MNSYIQKSSRNGRVPTYPTLNFSKATILQDHDTTMEPRKLTRIQCCYLMYLPCFITNTVKSKRFPMTLDPRSLWKPDCQQWVTSGRRAHSGFIFHTGYTPRPSDTDTFVPELELWFFSQYGQQGSETALIPVSVKSTKNARWTKRDKFGEKWVLYLWRRRIFLRVKCINRVGFCLKETPPGLFALSPAWPLYIWDCELLTQALRWRSLGVDTRHMRACGNTGNSCMIKYKKMPTPDGFKLSYPLPARRPDPKYAGDPWGLPASLRTSTALLPDWGSQWPPPRRGTLTPPAPGWGPTVSSQAGDPSGPPPQDGALPCGPPPRLGTLTPPALGWGLAQPQLWWARQLLGPCKSANLQGPPHISPPLARILFARLLCLLSETFTSTNPCLSPSQPTACLRNPALRPSPSPLPLCGPFPRCSKQA